MKHAHGGRGTHTTVIDPAVELVKASRRLAGVLGISNGLIKRGIGAKGRSVKITVQDSSHVQLVVVTPQSRQTFAVYCKDGQAKAVKRRLDELWREF